MPRNRKDKKKEKVDPFERARLKKLRSAQRREERKKRRLGAGDDGLDKRKKPDRPKQLHNADDLGWLGLNSIRMAANKVLNDSYRYPAPFWLSLPANPRPEPTNFYPCRSFQRGDRVWYGFLFRAHRDEQLRLWGNPKARKELTEDANMR